MSRDALGCTLLTFLVGGLLYLLFNSVNFLSPFENAFRDFNYTDIYYSKLQDTLTKTDKIILVNVGNASRFMMAKGIEKVALQNPKAIGLDMVFKDAKNEYFDSILKQTIQNTPNLITAYHFKGDSIMNNHPYFGTTLERSGYLDLEVDDETTVVRRFVGAKTLQDTLYSFPVKVGLAAGTISTEQLSDLLNKELTINYLGREEHYLRFDLNEILERESIPVLNNSIVLFGFLGNQLNDNFTIEDKHFTPLNPKFAGRSFPDMFGLVIQANILESLISNESIFVLPSWLNWILTFLCCWGLIVLGMRIGKKSPFAFDLGIKTIQLLTTIILLYFTYVLIKNNIHMKITPLLFLSLLGLEIICFYAHLTHFLKKRWPWKSYVLD